jgi:hypothetical protein
MMFPICLLAAQIIASTPDSITIAPSRPCDDRYTQQTDDTPQARANEARRIEQMKRDGKG